MLKKNNVRAYSLFALFALLILSVYSFSGKENVPNKNGIIFFQGTWTEAVAEAKKVNKPIFLDVYATWCPPCKLLKKNTFTHKEVAAFYNQNFINLSLNGEKGEGAQIAAKLAVTAYPTLFYFDKTGKPVLYSLGYHEPQQLIDAGKAALKNIP